MPGLVGQCLAVSAPPEDASLVQAARSGDRAAFGELYARYGRLVHGVLLSRAPRCEVADLVQDVFLAAWRRLPDLREPAAFGGWLRRLVRTQCARVRRRRGAQAERDTEAAQVPDGAGDAAELAERREVQGLIRRAVEQLPEGEREAVILFHLLGEPLRVVARVMGVSVGQAGKLAYNARLRLRRRLPRGITGSSLVRMPAPAFSRRVQNGVFDELVGVYRFVGRPDHRVIVRREGDVLTGHAGGQRNVMTLRGTDVLAPTEYDGEARIQRNRRGRVTGFVYYEFGRRLGVARKVAARARPTRARSASRAGRTG